jgi:hypothetical protein
MAATPLGIEFGAVYIITGPRGDRAVLNDPADPDFVGYLVGDDAITGLERAPVRESAEELPEADGGVHGAFRYGRWPFTLSGLVDTYTDPALSAVRQGKLLAATDAMLADATLAWTPSTAPPVFVRFRQQQATRITRRRPKAFLVAGVSEDPTIHSQELATVTVEAGATAGDSGLTSPLTSPLSSGQGATGQALVENLGNRPAWPVLTLEGPMSNPSILNLTTGDELVLEYVLLTGETLVIDTNPRRRTIRLNGTGNRYSALVFASSSWPHLAGGTVNDIRLSASTFSAPAKLTISYRHAWG